jgi:hypothetical protein
VTELLRDAAFAATVALTDLVITVAVWVAGWWE